VVPLEAVTEKVALPDNKTVWLKGWAVMTGGVPPAKQVLNTSKLMKSKHIAAFISRRFKGRLF
jgi:hypothetical protein